MSHLTIVANRLPVRLDESGDWVRSPGGLVSALAPFLEEQSGRWIGWVGVPDTDLSTFEHDGIELVPVPLSVADVEDYYEGFCNGTIWPLYHDAIRSVEMHRHWWHPYQDVNDRFAERVAATVQAGDRVWVQDYQLQLVPQLIRSRRDDVVIGFFLHIPFPPPEIFGRLPWRTQVTEGLLGADVLQFHTRRDQRNFARAAREYGGASGPAHALEVDGRTVRTEAHPISIDFELFAARAASDEVTAASKQLREDLGNPDHVVLGVDRLDYTKGIDIRLRAFATLLQERPDLHGSIVMVQLAVPSREAVDEYQVIREQVEGLVGRINGDFARAGWVPVHYRYTELGRDDLIAAYRAATTLIVTPLRDGMNLVAKEYVASRIDDDGVLVLSEFAGAAEELGDALVVNPYDADGLAAAVGEAVDMSANEQRRRMRRLRRRVQRSDVTAWARACLASLEQ